MATTAALPQIFRSFRCWKQVDIYLYSQDSKALPAFKTCSGQIESGPGAFPGFSCWRARANSSEVNSRNILVSRDTLEKTKGK